MNKMTFQDHQATNNNKNNNKTIMWIIKILQQILPINQTTTTATTIAYK
jgi:hypothetical protein